MTLFRFTKPSQLPITPEKLQRNKFYVGFGIVMLVSVVAIAYLDYQRRSIFIPETIAIASFGFAWLVKGQQILADKPDSNFLLLLHGERGAGKPLLPDPPCYARYTLAEESFLRAHSNCPCCRCRMFIDRAIALEGGGQSSVLRPLAGDWSMYAHDLKGTKFSSLKQINTQKNAQLKQVLVLSASIGDLASRRNCWPQRF